MRHAITFLLLIGTLCVTLGVKSANLARETQLRSQIRPALTQESVELQAGGLSFLALHRDTEIPKKRGAAILLHDMDANPDFPEVIRPLRVGLPRHGWETLSLQTPLATDNAERDAYLDLIPETLPRIDAAIRWLKQRKMENIVLIGHGVGANAVLTYAIANPRPPLRAVVTISLETGNDDLAGLRRLALPLLDIHGSHDLDGVLTAAQSRRTAIRQGNDTAYRQIEIVGADHGFRHFGDVLLGRIAAWCARILK